MDELEDDVGREDGAPLGLEDDVADEPVALHKRKAALLDDDDDDDNGHAADDARPAGASPRQGDGDGDDSGDEDFTGRGAAASDDDAEQSDQDAEPAAAAAGGGERERRRRRGKGSGGREKKRKKRRKQQGYQFIDDVADVDDDEEDDDEDSAEDGLAPDERFIEDDGAAAPRMADVDFRHDALERRWNEEDEARIIEHYQAKDRAVHYAAGEADDVLDQHSLLPSVTADPKLWLVKCVAGGEREIVAQLMQKYATLAARGRALGIFSAFCHDGAQGSMGSKREGHFYVEARTEKAVSEAVEGLRGVLRMKPLVRVPHAEMTDALTVRAGGKQALAPGAWVRIIGGGVYRGDLGRVARAEPDSTMTVKLLPRIDYAALLQRAEDRKNGIKAAPFGGMRGGGRNGVRPAAAPFSIEDARAADQEVETRRNEDNTYVMASRTFQDGYELKRLAARSLLELKDPPVEEVQRYLAAAVGASAEDAERALMAAAATAPGKFAVGDAVVVTGGDLNNMKGTVVELEGAGGRVWVMPRELRGFTEKIDFAPEELQKFVAVGARVKIVAGAHHVGDLGIVSHAADGVAEVLLDATEATIRVLVNNLTETADTRTGLETFGRYALHQLVQLTDGEVGMIVHISAEQAQLLMPTGAALRAVRQQDVRRPIETRRIPAPDCQRQRVSVQSLVEVVDGPHKGKTGTVAHVFKPHLWLHCRDVSKNNGYLVVLSNMTRVKGGSASSDAYGQARLPPQSPALGMRSPAHPGMGGPLGLQSPQHNPMAGGPAAFGGRAPLGGGGGRGGGRGGGGPGRGGLRDALIGKRVRVSRGAYRGYVGLVQHATDTHVRLELDATNKVVTLSRTVVEVDDGQGARPARGGGGGARLPPQTPMHAGARTPWYTPAYEAMPDPEGADGGGAYGGGSVTPAHAHPATPGTVPWTPGTGAGAPGHAPDLAALGLADTSAATLPAQTPGSGAAAAAAAAAAMTPGTMAASAGLGSLPAMTPGTAAFGRTPYTASATPGAALDEGRGGDAGEPAYAHYEGVQVYLGEDRGVVVSYDAASGEACVAQGAAAAGGTIDVSGQGGTRSLAPVATMRLVEPRVGDPVKIVTASGRTPAGAVGSMIGVDNEDGIVKLQPSNDIQILPMRAIARLNAAPA